MKKQKVYYEQNFTDLTRKRYNRWRGMLDRCYNENYHHFATIGGRGIRVAEIWVNTNPKGLENFGNWVEIQFALKPEIAEIDYKIYRLDNAKDFSPDNCVIGSPQQAVQKRISTILDFDTVVELRRLKRRDPEISVRGLARLHNVTSTAMSSALRGLTWANVNAVEPPIKSLARVECVCIIETEDETEAVS